MGDSNGNGNGNGKAVPRALRLVRLGARELAGDPELARSVQLLVDTLERRAALGTEEQRPATWIVALEALGGTAAAPRADKAIQRALEAMQLDLRRRWSVQSLAKAVGLSRAVFARRFALAAGVSPIAYLAERRLARAAERLSEGAHSLAEVAAEVGYESEFAFSRAFKRRHGIPPAAYRRLRTAAAPVCLALAA